MTGNRVMFPTPDTCWTKRMMADETAGSRKASMTKRVSQTRFRRAGPSASTMGAAGCSSIQSVIAGAFQNDHPSGGGGHSRGGRQPGGGLHPGGGSGQFGGDRQSQSGFAIVLEARSQDETWV